MSMDKNGSMTAKLTQMLGDFHNPVIPIFSRSLEEAEFAFCIYCQQVSRLDGISEFRHRIRVQRIRTGSSPSTLRFQLAGEPLSNIICDNTSFDHN